MAYRASSSGGASYTDDNDDSSPTGRGTADEEATINYHSRATMTRSRAGSAGGGTATTVAASSSSPARRSAGGRDAGTSADADGDEDLSDKPLHLLEHLATFTVDKAAGILLPADGIRRLLQLEKTTGIWSQKMQLCLDQNWVLIVDYESGSVIERFAADTIMEPTAFTSTSPMDMYNNVLVFIVAGIGVGSRSEMHIFQSQSTSAIRIVEDLKHLRDAANSSPRQQHHSHHQQQRRFVNNHHHHQPQIHSTSVTPKHSVSAPPSSSGIISPKQQHSQHSQHRKSSQSAISAFLPNYDGHQMHALHADADASSELSVNMGHNDSDRSRSRSRSMHHQQQQQQQQRFNHQQRHHHQQQHHHHPDDMSSSASNSEKYERDVGVLNHCFDDIEKFIARLQHAAAASRELERRQYAARKSSNKKSKSSPSSSQLVGDGLLSLRTKPPYEKEFIDIFAKFKLSFNLLAKLRAHIHDPNAPELIHFLFTPLALIVDASHDAYYSPNISGRTVDPLLTREAINLLANCVTSKETELWRSLGDTWTVPRDQWSGHVGSYHPVFFDGWSPEYPVIDDAEDETNAIVHKGTAQQQQHNHHHQNHLISAHHPHHQLQHSEFDYDPKFVPSSSASPAAMVNNHNNGPNNNNGLHGGREFSTTRSELSTTGADSIVMLERGGGGSISHQLTHHMSQVSAAMAQHWLESVHARGGKIVQTTHPRTANNDKELTVMRGEYLEMLDDTRKWWKCANARGLVGHVPHTIIIPWQYGEAPVSPTASQIMIPNSGATNKGYSNGRKGNGMGQIMR